MVRTVKHKSGEFIVVNTSLEVFEKGVSVKVPIVVQIDVSKLNLEDYTRIFRAGNSLFNRTLTLNNEKPKKNEKPWWKKLFK